MTDFQLGLIYLMMALNFHIYIYIFLVVFLVFCSLLCMVGQLFIFGFLRLDLCTRKHVIGFLSGGLARSSE